MPRFIPALAGAAVVVLVAALALNFFTNQQGIGAPATPPPPSVAPTAAPTAIDTPTARPSLPSLGMPSSRGSPPGQYGWEGRLPGALTGMHYVVEDREAAAMGFAVGPDCLVTTGNPEPDRIEIGDLDGVLIEPYEPAFQFMTADDEITRAYALDVGDSTLCIFLTWHPTSTMEEIASAEATVQSLRAEPLADGGVRIVFDLFDKWDTG